MIFPIVTGTSPACRLVSCSYGRKSNKVAKLRTAYKSELPVTGFGEIDAYLTKDNKAQNMVLGYKSVLKPFGACAFEVDQFRQQSRVWQLPEKSTLAPGIVAVNLEPGFWVFAPAEDMDLNKYRTLLETNDWIRIKWEDRKDIIGYGEGTTPSTKRDGLIMIDQLIIQALESFIRDALMRTGMAKYEDELVSLDNDINRARIYLQNYQETSPNPTVEPYIKGGTIVRADSNKHSVLRPRSELFRQIIKFQIDQNEKTSKKETAAGKHGKAGLYQSHNTLLQQFLVQHFGPNEPANA